MGEARTLTAEGDGNAPEVLALRAQALYASGNMPMAQRHFEEALRRDPDLPHAQKGLRWGNPAMTLEDVEVQLACWELPVATTWPIQTCHTLRRAWGGGPTVSTWACPYLPQYGQRVHGWVDCSTWQVQACFSWRRGMSNLGAGSWDQEQ